MSRSWWRCRTCGYIYKPEIGDGVAKVELGTPFADLPDDWLCPVCFVEKHAFFAFTPEEPSE